MRLVFFANASHEIGVGHVMRSSAIAEEAISQGLECVFLGNFGGIEWLENRVTSLGFSSISLPETFIPRADSDLLILDTYHLAPTDPLIASGRWLGIVSILDSATPNYNAGLYIHLGFSPTWYSGDWSNFHFGPQYIPVRKSLQFQGKGVHETLENILVFGGGSDPFDFATAVAKVLSNLNSFSKAFFISENSTEILKIDSRYSVGKFGGLIEDHLKRADLVFTTASTSCFEMIAQGIPVGLGCAIENQMQNYSFLGANGFASQIGLRVLGRGWDIRQNELKKIVNDFSYRRELVTRGKQYMDFDGSSRILALILERFSKANHDLSLR